MKKELLVRLDGDTIDAANAAVLSGKLLQMANGAIYNDEREARVIHHRKLEMPGRPDRAGQRGRTCWWLTGSSMIMSVSGII